MNPLSKVSDACRKLLTSQHISLDGPGTILKDVQVMLEMIGTRGLRSKSRNGNLPMEVLPELNRRMCDPITLALGRPTMKDYPNLAGLYVLLRVIELLRVDSGRVRVDEAVLARWLQLNPTEQYFSLLEAWLLEADSSVLGIRNRRGSGQLDSNLLLLTSLNSSTFTKFPEYIQRAGYGGSLEAWNTQLLMRFGLAEIRERPAAGRLPTTARGWLMEKARRTPWGEAVACGMWEALKPETKRDVDLGRFGDDAGYGFLLPVFQPYFPQWQQLFAPPITPLPSGVFIVKASLGGAWCLLAVPPASTLDCLANAVLDAFGFDNEHLYEMSYRDDRGIDQTFCHDYCAGAWAAADVTLTASGWPEKSTMRFLYDFGDSWRFSLRLERIDPPDASLHEPKLLTFTGTPPEQYPTHDEELEY